jgi:hypothetical protein
VNEWIRKGNSNVKGMSNCWKALHDYLSIVTDWLAWKPGNGKYIRVGLDPLIGSHNYYKLSENLISLLHSKVIYTLDQVVYDESGLTNICNWKNTDALELTGEQKVEWENYVKGLKHSGFALSTEGDRLVWTWNNKLGIVSAKEAYEMQFLEKREDVQK